MELRTYQQEVIDEVRASFRAGVRRLCVQIPTGGGKTVLAAHMIKSAQNKGHNVWFNVHRRELVKQSLITLSNAAEVDAGVVAAGWDGDRRLPVQVCMVSSLARRHHRLTPPKLIIWDEAHHIAAASWTKIFEAYPDAYHVALTATPRRLDGTGLDQWFDKLICGPSVTELIELGALADYKMFAPTLIDMNGVKTTAGDFNRKDLDAAMKKSSVTGDVMSHYERHCPGKRMVVFAWSVASSEELAVRFNDRGIPAKHVDGKTNAVERDAAMAAFKRGEIKVLCNVDLFGEGVDVPAIEAVALLRPTQSLTLYLQQVGRSLRPAPGKDHAIILDHAGNSDRHGLPDDDRQWTLAGREKGKRKKAIVQPRRCQMCYAMSPSWATECKSCGRAFPDNSRQVAELEGDLSEVERAKAVERLERKREQSMANTLEELIEVGRSRNYKNPVAWAKHIFHARKAKGVANDAMRFIGV